MNKHVLLFVLVASSVSTNQSILPGGCIVTNLPDGNVGRKTESVSLSNHHTTVKAGQEFTVNYNFGRGSDADAWGVINLTSEIELINCYQLESFPPTTVWVFKPNFAGNYTIFFQNKLSHDVISVHVKVIS